MVVHRHLSNKHGNVDRSYHSAICYIAMEHEPSIICMLSMANKSNKHGDFP